MWCLHSLRASTGAVVLKVSILRLPRGMVGDYYRGMVCPVHPSVPNFFSKSDRRAAVEQAIFAGDRSGSLRPFAECERPAQFVAVFSRESIHLTLKFGVRNIGDLSQVTTRKEECITWLALHPGSTGEVFP